MRSDAQHAGKKTQEVKPCAHCILAATVGTVLRAAISAGPMPKLTATSPTAPGVVRTWSRVEDFIEEVALARIYAGVHYRNSKSIAELALTRHPGGRFDRKRMN